MSGTRRSGLALIIAGTVGALFFWLSDARYGLARRWTSADTLVDAANEVWPGTFVGVIGCLVLLLIGLWLMTRGARQ